MSMRKQLYRIITTFFILHLIFGLCTAWAGPNSSAIIALDMNHTTHEYDPSNPSQDIESEIKADMNEEIWTAVVAQNVTNLDTYQVEVSFDPENLMFIEGREDDSSLGITNLLKKNGGTTIGFRAVERVSGIINIANTLVGTDINQAPDTSGIIAILKFRVLDNTSENHLTLSNVYCLDSDRTNDAIPETNLMNAVQKNLVANEIPGDLDGDGDTDRDDAAVIKTYVNQSSDACPECDLDGDGKITVLDARKLTMMCTCQRCICQ